MGHFWREQLWRCQISPTDPSLVPDLLTNPVPVATTATSLPGPSLHLESVIRAILHFAPNLLGLNIMEEANDMDAPEVIENLEDLTLTSREGGYVSEH